MTVSIAPNRITHMDELTFPGTPFPHPEDFEGDAPQIPFPPVEAYVEEAFDYTDITLAFSLVRESTFEHLGQLASELHLMRLPATQEDVRRVALVRTVVLGALESLR